MSIRFKLVGGPWDGGTYNDAISPIADTIEIPTMSMEVAMYELMRDVRTRMIIEGVYCGSRPLTPAEREAKQVMANPPLAVHK